MTSLLQAGWAAAVTLALYSFYCFWEAGRADLVHGFRHLVPGELGTGGHAYRARGWCSAVAAILITVVCLASAL